MKFGTLTNGEWLKLMLDHMGKAKDSETIILKGHLLMEYVLNGWIERSNVDLVDAYKGFSFGHKLKMFSIFCNTELIDEMRHLNKLRNSIAHTLEYDENEVDKFIENVNKKVESLLNKPAKKKHVNLIWTLISLLQQVRVEIYNDQQALFAIHSGFMETVERDLKDREVKSGKAIDSNVIF